jgi:D-serine deaminase-like pyridoxal phosphate-dependent protein
MTALTDLETPAVTVHLDGWRRVQAHLDPHGINNRPSIMSPDIGKMQMAA